MDYNWLVFSLSATLLLGISVALYKVPSFKNESRYVTAFWSMIFPFFLSIIFFSGFLNLSSPKMILTALIWGISFSLLVLLQMKALKDVDTNALFPVTSIISLVTSLVAGFLLFKEIISLVQFIGIFLVIVVVYFYLYKKENIRYSNEILFLGLGIIFFSAFNKIIQKFVAEGFDIHAYQIYQYAFATLFSFLILIYFHKKKTFSYFTKKSFLSGSLIGIFAFFGGYALLTALTKGPFVLIMSIHSLYIFVTALTGFFLFKEKLDKKIILLILVSVLAVILMRLG